MTTNEYKEYHENGCTEQTGIRYLGEGRYEVEARGGYDGYLVKEFAQIEDALDYVVTLWKRNTARL
jgi:hypothetical protein